MKKKLHLRFFSLAKVGDQRTNLSLTSAAARVGSLVPILQPQLQKLREWHIELVVVVVVAL